MDKGFRLVVATILATCVSASAQDWKTFEPMNTANANLALAASHGGSPSPRLFTLGNSPLLPAPLSLIDNDPFIFMNAFAWTALSPAVVLPSVPVLNRIVLATPLSDTPIASRPIALERNSGYVWGEIGGLYGTTVGGGKSSLEAKEGFIQGGLGDQRTQITVGASYSNWRGTLPGTLP